MVDYDGNMMRMPNQQDMAHRTRPTAQMEHLKRDGHVSKWLGLGGEHDVANMHENGDGRPQIQSQRRRMYA